MLDPKEMYDTDGVELPRMTGDSADQVYDDDSMDSGTTGTEPLQRRGGSGGLSSGTGQIAADVPTTTRE